MPIIDVWIQHPNARFLREPWLASILRWTGQEDMPARPLPTTLQALDQARVALGLLSAWHGPQGALISNDEVAACVAQAPRRLAGLASVDLYQPMAGVRELRRCVRELGFVGLRSVPWLWSLPPDDRRYYPLYAECIELDIPFCTQVGHTGPLLSSEPGRPIPYLERVLLDFPDLRVVGGHLGAPWLEEIYSLLHKFPNFHVDTSAYKLSRLPPHFAEFMRSSGAKQILFGSNYPMIAPADCLQGLDALELPTDATARFLYQNAQRVFKLPLALD
ncbi:MAG: amidohydrolase [Halioglobus sp.]|nr:amidohydrolase [Halioglobus sp.]